MNDDRVLWKRQETATPAVCAVCGNAAGNRVLLSARHWRPERGMLELAECASCRSCFYPQAGLLNSDYPALEETLLDPGFPLLVHHYLEIVAGLDWKVWLLEQLPFERFRSVLEIGCNCGVAVDYCRTMWSVEAIGLEPSAYGVVGSHMLEVPVLPKYMKDATELHDRRFDFVFATEVLEHVPDPLGFLREVRARLAPDGVLMLTTPRSGAISTATPIGQLYAALSPGAHFFMLSPDALRDLLQRAGFTHVDLSEFGMTNVAVASDGPVARQAPPHVELRLAQYYRRRHDVREARVRLGHGINHYVYASRTGTVEGGAALSATIDIALSDLFGIDLVRPEGLIERVTAARHLVELGREMPYGLPFYLAARAADGLCASESATHDLLVASLLAVNGLRIDFQNLFVYHELFERIWPDVVRRQHEFGAREHALHSRVRALIEEVPELRTPSNSYVARGVRKLQRLVERLLGRRIAHG